MTMLEEASEQLGTRVLKAAIREGVQLKEAGAAKKSIFRYAPHSMVKWDYEQLVNEIERLIEAEKEAKN